MHREPDDVNNIRSVVCGVVKSVESHCFSVLHSRRREKEATLRLDRVGEGGRRRRGMDMGEECKTKRTRLRRVKVAWW